MVTTSCVARADLVLYSVVKNLWKISDFGFTSQAASNSKAMSSVYARGTPGYRAPELIIDNPIRFTKKVDVWALGCIFYELITNERAFKDDYSVQEYYQSTSRLTITTSNLPNTLQSHLHEVLQELLQRDPQFRPQMAELRHMFQSYCAILDQTVAPAISDVSSIPVYSQWKKLIGNCQNQ